MVRTGKMYSAKREMCLQETVRAGKFPPEKREMFPEKMAWVERRAVTWWGTTWVDDRRPNASFLAPQVEDKLPEVVVRMVRMQLGETVREP
jgi:hypothetical protein